jgi:hypothetical protein
MDSRPPASGDTNLGLDPEDYYFEGPYLVFTAAYHLKRGACCGSGCRHCPYKESEKKEEAEVRAQRPPPEGPPAD